MEHLKAGFWAYHPGRYFKSLDQLRIEPKAVVPNRYFKCIYGFWYARRQVFVDGVGHDAPFHSVSRPRFYRFYEHEERTWFIYYPNGFQHEFLAYEVVGEHQSSAPEPEDDLWI